MSSRSVRRALAPCLLAVAIALGGCGRGAPDQAIRTGSAGQDPGAPTTSAPAAVIPSTAVSTTTTAAPTPSGPAATTTTTTVATGTEGDPSPSVVDGLSPADVKAAVLAPASATARRAPGATVERVTLGSGATVWRVRIPGTFPARSARVSITVGDRVVGTGITAPDLGALVAVTADGAGLTAGASVSYRWEGSEPVAAGTLGVVR